MAIPDFEKLGLSAVIVGMDMYPNKLERVVPFLKEHDRVKLLWKTYGKLIIFYRDSTIMF